PGSTVKSSSRRTTFWPNRLTTFSKRMPGAAPRGSGAAGPPPCASSFFAPSFFTPSFCVDTPSESSGVGASGVVSVGGIAPLQAADHYRGQDADHDEQQADDGDRLQELQGPRPDLVGGEQQLRDVDRQQHRRVLEHRDQVVA